MFSWLLGGLVSSRSIRFVARTETIQQFLQWVLAAAVSGVELSFAVNQNTLVVAKITQFMRFDLVLLGFRNSSHCFFRRCVPVERLTTRFFQKVGSLNGVGFIGGTKDYPIAKVQRQVPLICRCSNGAQ